MLIQLIMPTEPSSPTVHCVSILSALSADLNIIVSNTALCSGVPGPRVGYMPQELALYGEFTIRETLQYFGR